MKKLTEMVAEYEAACNANWKSNARQAEAREALHNALGKERRAWAARVSYRLRQLKAREKGWTFHETDVREIINHATRPVVLNWCVKVKLWVGHSRVNGYMELSGIGEEADAVLEEMTRIVGRGEA